MKKRDKKLIPCETKIGELVGNYKGQIVKASVFYGNFISPMIDDKEFVHLDEKPYYKMLNDFLASDEGEEYIIPSDIEIHDACYEVTNRELQIVKERLEAEGNAEEDSEELTQLISMEKNQKQIKRNFGIISPMIVFELLLAVVVCLSYFGYNLYLQFNELQNQLVQIEDYVYQNPIDAQITISPNEETTNQEKEVYQVVEEEKKDK